VDAAIEHWLRRLVQFLRVDRAGVSQVSPDGNAVELTHFYGIKGSPPPTTLLHNQYPWFVEQVRTGQMIRLEHIPDLLPPEAAAESSYAKSVWLKSHLMLPLMVAGTSLGALAFGCFRRYRTWPDEVVKRLELVAQVFGNALARKRARLQLSERLVFERLIADLVKDLVNASPDEIDSVIAGRLEAEILPDDIADLLNLPPGMTGLILKTVAKGSPADEMGLRGATMIANLGGQQIPLGGDIILSVEGISGGVGGQPGEDPRPARQQALGRDLQGHGASRGPSPRADGPAAVGGSQRRR
jgi:hypothetical protein